MDFTAYKDSLDGKPLAVFGLGASGLAVVRALIAPDISVTAWDDKQDNIEKAKQLGAKTEDLTKIDLSDFAALILAPRCALYIQTTSGCRQCTKA